MPGNPQIPRNKDNPVGQGRRVNKFARLHKQHIARVRKWLLDTLDGIPTNQITANAGGITVNRYEYLIDPIQLDAIVQEIRRRTLDPSVANAMIREVRGAYEQGTGDEVRNLVSISDGQYTREVTQVLRSQPWQQRVALIQSRVFEEMQGFQGDTGQDLARVLRSGVENGLNPRDVAEDIRDRFGVSQSRAERIARTEINQAYRRARLDEDEDANQRLGIRTGLLWFSALSPTTRPNHAARHGRVYTQDEVRKFYSEGSEQINCKCSQSSVLLDDEGNPVNPAFIDRVKSMK